MPNQTPNYNLVKPLTTENYDVNVFNGNADIIDSTLKQISDYKIDKSKIINNLLVTEEGFVLDARQGKFISDILNNFNDSRSINNINIDTFTNAGFKVIRLGDSNINGSFPSELGEERFHCVLIDIFSMVQILISTNNLAYAGNKMYRRTRFSSSQSWVEWIKM